jgi:branched-chain amino acid transport system permease protein
MRTDVKVSRATTASRLGGVVFVLGAVVLAAGPLLFINSTLRTLVQFFYLLALAQMWNLLAGYAGLVSIGQQAYIGIGAYGLLYFSDNLGVNLFVAVFLAGLLASLLAIPTSALVFRLRGGYFAIGTWVVAEVYRLVVQNSQSLGGGTGATIPVLGIDRQLRQYVTYWIALAIGLGSILLVYFVLRSRLGLALRAVRDRETAAPTLGIDVHRTKVKVYVLASAVGGLTGAVIYLNLLRLQPEATFSVNWTAFMIFAVVIGGIGTISGPIVGTIVYFLLQQYLADLGSVYLIILGAIAVLLMLKAPRGLWGLIMDRWNVPLFPVQLRVKVPRPGSEPPDGPPMEGPPEGDRLLGLP